MSSGELTNILVSTDVTRYLEFKQVAGSYVQQGAAPKATVAKVPSDAGEALKSPLMGLFEKRRMKSFIEWVGSFDAKDPATHQGWFISSCSPRCHAMYRIIADCLPNPHRPRHEHLHHGGSLRQVRPRGHH
jgi:Rab GDP dissociation inhibitor